VTPILVLTTCPDLEIAEKIAKSLTEEHLAACVQVGRPIKSYYRFKGNLHEDLEIQVSIKTKEACFDRVCHKIRQLHPYEIPQIISIPILSGLDTYLAWLNQETR
jgi:periplasmic divalent cation tolerance protein